MHISNTPKRDGYMFAAILNSTLAACCALAATFVAVPSLAQKGGSRGGTGGGTSHGSSSPGIVRSAPGYPDVYSNSSPVPTSQPLPTTEPLPKPVVYEDEKCLPWDISGGHDTAVSVKRLKVPSGARSEYEKACSANNKQKFGEAEQHARKAIDKFQEYPAAWVMLGVVLEEEHKSQDARDSCSHAMSVDSKYVPAYLCNAEFLTREQQWEQVLNVANQAVGLNSAGDSYANYYRATAFYYMNNLDDAKKSALQAAENDVSRNRLPLYFLLAHIYEAQGDRAEAVARLRQILKQHNDRQDEDAVKQYLTKLEVQEESK